MSSMMLPCTTAFLSNMLVIFFLKSVIVLLRFIIENSIEDRILKLQEKKKLVFDGIIFVAESLFKYVT
jgi:multisubunit Na+/H+ antiporter MnhF subunit